MRCAVLLFALTFAAGSSARADEFITYTMSALFQGTLTNGNTTTPLTDQAFTLSLTADLNDVENNISNNIFATPFASSLTYSLAGFGSGTYVANVQLKGANGVAGLSFVDDNNNTITMLSSDFISYNLTTLLNLSGITLESNMTQFVTQFGTLNLTSPNPFTNAAFSVTETPEPGSLLLTSLCFAGIFAVLLRKKRSSLPTGGPTC